MDVLARTKGHRAFGNELKAVDLVVFMTPGDQGQCVEAVGLHSVKLTPCRSSSKFPIGANGGMFRG